MPAVFFPTLIAYYAGQKMFLESHEWLNDQYAERVLDIEPKNGRAYITKLLCELNCESTNELLKYTKDMQPDMKKGW